MSAAYEYPQLSPVLRERSLFKKLGFFGPGAIIACVTIGSGETVFASRGGAIYEYTMLWCFLIGALCKGFQVYSGSRFITLTGRSPLQSWMDLPGPRGWFVITLSILTIACMPFWLAGLPTIVGHFSNWVVGIEQPVRDAFATDAAFQEAAARYNIFGLGWGTFYLAVALIITWLQTYGFLEKTQTAIVALLLICMVVAAVVAHPDWNLVLLGLLPRSPRFEPWVLEAVPKLTERSPWVEIIVYMGVIGGGAQDYFGYIGMLREKGWGLMGRTDLPTTGEIPQVDLAEDNIHRGHAWLLPAKIDIGVATLAILVFTLCFVILGAAVLHPRQSVPDGMDLLTQQSDFLMPLAGDSSMLKFAIGWTYNTGIFFAFFGTILGACELFTRTMRECLIAIKPHWEAVPLRKFRAWTLLYAGGGGMALLWACGLSGVNPVKIITPAALLGSGLVCGLWCFGMIWSDHKQIPKPLRMGPGLLVAVALSGVLLTAFSIVAIAEEVSNYIAYFQQSEAAAAEITPQRSSAKNALVPPKARLEQVFARSLALTGGLTEGPAAAPDGNIYFSDIPLGDQRGKIMCYNPVSGKTTVFAEESHKANGLAFDQQGRLVACEGADHGGRCLARWNIKTGQRQVLVDRYQGKRLNAPNDLCIDTHGNIYFTDPKYVGPESLELERFSVYKLQTDGTLREVTHAVQKPNGIAISPDGRTLYVADTNNGTHQAEAADPEHPPQRGNMRVVALKLDRQGRAVGPPQTLVDFAPHNGCDGMTVDQSGRLYLAIRSLARPGVMVLDTDGRELAFIPTGPANQTNSASPQGIPSNVEFGQGEQRSVLYVTVDQALYRIPLKTGR